MVVAFESEVAPPQKGVHPGSHHQGVLGLCLDGFATPSIRVMVSDCFILVIGKLVLNIRGWALRCIVPILPGVPVSGCMFAARESVVIGGAAGKCIINKGSKHTYMPTVYKYIERSAVVCIPDIGDVQLVASSWMISPGAGEGRGGYSIRMLGCLLHWNDFSLRYITLSGKLRCWRVGWDGACPV
jgi:hypothetical protein